MTPGAGIFRTKLPTDFLAGGINCGVRRYRPDLGLILSRKPCVAAGVYTQNKCKAAPLKHCANLLPSDNITAIITNSGQANAATGYAGEQANRQMAQTLADQLQCDVSQILTASTGVIGEPLAIDKITQAIPILINNLSNISEKFATAILTTDLVPKTVYKQIQLSQGTVCITGICKGSGMIHPNMATMLGYLLTDAKLSMEQTQTLLSDTCDNSFNMISVDGETSTNDCVFLLANAASGVSLVTEQDLQKFKTALHDIAIILAKSIAQDGEGASKLIEVTVSGLPELAQARQLARSLTVSPLIKTAICGASPNWGRILARIGAEITDDRLLECCSISLQELTIYANGQPVNVDLARLKQAMQLDKITIHIQFAAQGASATAWGCDLTAKYVTINADYVT
jgi:glutamate N-acetyltransferase / amino-acid N-acetyltransferase